MTPAIGDLAPAFELQDTRGEVHSLTEGPLTVIVWTCNHCPYALAWHGRIAAVADEYAARGVRVLCVCSNDASRYPKDSLEAMRERAEAEAWRVPYLHDPTQEAARAFGARTTPDVFVVDAAGRLRYRGAPDADHSDPAQDAAWLRSAIDRILAGGEPDPASTDPVGCSIKWRQDG